MPTITTTRRAASVISTTSLTDMLDLILGPMTYGFMQRGLVAAVLVGIVCAVMGAFVVLISLLPDYTPKRYRPRSSLITAVGGATERMEGKSVVIRSDSFAA